MIGFLMLTWIAWRGEDERDREGNVQTGQLMYVKCVCTLQNFFPH